MGLINNAKVMFGTVCAAITHKTVKSTFGSYKKAKEAQGNINLLGLYQSSDYIPKNGFVEDNTDYLDLDSLFANNDSSEEINLAALAGKSDKPA